MVGYAPTLSVDRTKSSGTFSTITDLTFPVASGKNYTVIFVSTWEHTSTSGGPIFGFDHPGGACRGLFQYTGETSGEAVIYDQVSAVDSGDGIATTQVADTGYFCTGSIRYQCTSSGTWSMRIARNTTGTTTIHAGSSLFVTSD